jgi:hypothetical protein
MLLKLGEAGAAQLFVCQQVLGEIEWVIRRKSPGHLSVLALLLDRCRVEIAPSASIDDLECCRVLIPHQGDARILADAWSAGVDYLVTLDRAYFLTDTFLSAQTPFLFGTPGECLAWYRDIFREHR